MKTTTIVALVSFAGAASIATLDAAVRSRSNAAMTRAANQFLQTLTPEQRVKAAFKFDSTERFNWFFTPVPRLGLPLKEMTEPQRTAARALLATGVSQRGLLKANTIIELELVLREMETGRITRDPELYFVSIFGTPSETQPWGVAIRGAPPVAQLHGERFVNGCLCTVVLRSKSGECSHGTPGRHPRSCPGRGPRPRLHELTRR